MGRTEEHNSYDEYYIVWGYASFWRASESENGSFFSSEKVFENSADCSNLRYLLKMSEANTGTYRLKYMYIVFVVSLSLVSAVSLHPSVWKQIEYKLDDSWMYICYSETARRRKEKKEVISIWKAEKWIRGVFWWFVQVIFLTV